MDINNMIKRYDIVLITEGVNAGNIASRATDLMKKENALEAIKAAKPEIVAELQRRIDAERVAAEERDSKIAAIEGLKSIQAAQGEWSAYHCEYERRMESESESSILPARPAVSVSDLTAKYPRAAAYLKAESYTYADNYTKASAGKKALERIIDGEDYNTVLADMDAEWRRHCQKRMWD